MEAKPDETDTAPARGAARRRGRIRRCVVADDHPAVVHALTELLSDNGYEVAGTARDGLEAVALASERPPDCAVVDYRMPGLEGPELIRQLRRAAPGTAIVVYTGEGSPKLAAEALAAGASAVVLKEAPVGDVVHAVDAAVEGESYVDPVLSGPAAPPPHGLTDREHDVLALLAEGLNYEEIGERLAIAGETVRSHLKNACLRLGAGTRTQAVAEALRLGWIE